MPNDPRNSRFVAVQGHTGTLAIDTHDRPQTKQLETMARRYQQTRVEHDGTEYRITVDSDHVSVKAVEWMKQDGRSIQMIGDVSKEERAEVLLANPHLSTAKSYRRAYSHAKRRKRYA